jgi:hypothetical protein
VSATLERLARDAWKRWGDGYALYTVCKRCGRVKHCRGRSRERMLCLDCWDETHA